MNEIQDIYQPVYAQQEYVVGCHRLAVPGLLQHDQLREDGHRLENQGHGVGVLLHVLEDALRRPLHKEREGGGDQEEHGDVEVVVSLVVGVFELDADQIDHGHLVGQKDDLHDLQIEGDVSCVLLPGDQIEVSADVGNQVDQLCLQGQATDRLCFEDLCQENGSASDQKDVPRGSNDLAEADEHDGSKIFRNFQSARDG